MFPNVLKRLCVSGNEPFPLKGELLFSVYFIVPTLLVFVFLDLLFWGGSVRGWLPRTPESLIAYLLIFNLPHILASFFSFADKDYLIFYKKPLLWGLPIIWILTGVLVFLYPKIALLCTVVGTMYHVMLQQAGVALFFIGRPPSLYGVWKWLAIINASVFYGLIYYPRLFVFTYGTEIIIALTVLFAILSFHIWRKIERLAGKKYFSVASGALLGSALFLALGYPLLSIFSIRFVHDVTAFFVYATHDSNRALRKGNILYNLFPNFLPVLLLTPFLAILFAYPLTKTFYTSSALFFCLISFTHYYTESFVWKRGSLHREYLSVVT